jgi:hypothetical protein
MAKSATERQAEYRARRSTAGDNGERRLNLWISTGSALALGRLARRYCVTKQEMIEKLLRIEDEQVSASIDLDSPEWDAYFGTTTVTR